MVNEVWVFNGTKSSFPAAVFCKMEEAEIWIAKYRLSGVLTLYPLDIGIYDWAIGNGYFTPNGDNQSSPEFIQKFTSAIQHHYHYENGVRE